MSMCVPIPEFEPTSVPLQRMLSSITANLDLEIAAGSQMSPLPPATGLRPPKNTLVPLVANGALVAEVEKVKVELDCVISEVANIKEMVRLGLVEVDSAVAVPPVPPVDLAVTLTLMMCQYDEMRRAMACDQEKMRAFIRNRAIAMVVLIFVMTIVVVSHVHVLVYTLTEPVVFESSAPVCTPYFDCIAKFLAREIAKTTRDEWAH